MNHKFRVWWASGM